MHEVVRRWLAGREACQRHDTLIQVVGRTGHNVTPFTFVELARTIGVSDERMTVILDHLASRHALVYNQGRVVIQDEGRNIARDGTLLEDGRNQVQAWYMAVGARLALVATAVSISVAVYQVMKNDRLEERIQALEMQSRSAATAPADSSRSVGR